MSKTIMRFNPPMFYMITIATIILVILKLAGIITWPWLWVFCPIWIGMATLLFTLLLICGIVLLLVVIAIVLALGCFLMGLK